MKTCQFCAEEIQDAAVKCKHCGSWLDGRDAKPAAARGPVKVTTTSGGSMLKLIGFVLCALGLVVAIAGAASDSDGAGTAGGVMLFLGFVTFVTGRFQD